ncbi:MAG: DUF4249 domain-containing protein [Chitinophagales bacterium]
MKTLLCVFLLSCLFSSCEKDISFDLSQSASQLVVEATIENGLAPRVILSKSLNYFSEISPDILEASFVHGAEIVISNGIKNQTLKEYALPVDSSGYQLFFYSSDSSDLTNSFVGELNSQYSLSITAEGKKYTASTTIPALTKKVDSLWWKQAPNNPDTNKVILRARVTDPPGYGNYVRYFTSTNWGPFFPGLNSVFDDQIVDGTTYDIDVDKGVNRNQSIDLENYAFFTRGDTVITKLCNIDKATYDFWRTMEYSYRSIGNPFSSPTKVLGNISNNGLGYFGGYAAQYDTIFIPK